MCIAQVKIANLRSPSPLRFKLYQKRASWIDGITPISKSIKSKQVEICKIYPVLWTLWHHPFLAVTSLINKSRLGFYNLYLLLRFQQIDWTIFVIWKLIEGNFFLSKFYYLFCLGWSEWNFLFKKVSLWAVLKIGILPLKGNSLKSAKNGRFQKGNMKWYFILNY